MLDTYVNKISRVRTAADNFSFVQAFNRNMSDLATAQAKTEARQGKINHGQTKQRAAEIMAAHPEELVLQATLDADVATFHNSNSLTDFMRRGRNGLSPMGNFFLDLPLPFEKSVTNVIGKGLEYSGLGMVNATYKALRAAAKRSLPAEEQRAMAQTFGRGAMGVGFLALGYTLAAKNLMTGTTDDEPSKRERDEAIGRGPMKVYNPVTQTWHTYKVLGPIAVPLAIGATFFRESHTQLKDESQRAAKYAKGASEILLQTPHLRAIREISEAVTKPGSSPTRVGRVLGGFIPTPLSEAAGAIDSKERDAQGFIAPIKERIPGLRQSLPEKINPITGQPAEHRRIWALDPTRTTKALERTDPVAKELQRLDVGVTNPQKQPGESPNDFRARLKQIGQTYNAASHDLVKSKEYQQSDTLVQKTALERLSRLLKQRSRKPEEELYGWQLEPGELIFSAEESVRKAQEKKAVRR